MSQTRDNSFSNSLLLFLSFGQSAVFLLGGQTIEDKPTAMLIRSGDIVVMSGTSRLCYHGIPRILSTDATPWNDMDLRTKHMPRTSCALCDREDCASVKGITKQADLAFFPSCFSSEIINSCLENNFWEPFESYLRTSRINMNVRQVLHSGTRTLPQQL
jgi:alkylated DNA repair protein alkB family protein 1